MGTLIDVIVVLSVGYALCVLVDAIERWYMRGRFKMVGFDLWYHNGERWERVDDRD